MSEKEAAALQAVQKPRKPRVSRTVLKDQYIVENVELKNRVLWLEHALAAYQRKGFWRRIGRLVRGNK